MKRWKVLKYESSYSNLTEQIIDQKWQFSAQGWGGDFLSSSSAEVATMDGV